MSIRTRKSGGGLSPGDKRGRLTVVGHQWREKKYWKCVAKCDCGVLRVYLTHSVGKGTFSCGCLNKDLQPVRGAKSLQTKIKNGTVREDSERLKKCERCQRVYRVDRRRTRYCSHECRWPGGKRKHDCLQCGKEFFDSRSFAKLCSVECHNVYQTTAPRKELECECCGVKFTTLADKGKWPRFCSRVCFLLGIRSPEYETHPTQVYFKGGKVRGGHRIAVEKLIGRPLEHCGEPIIHLNGKKRDNRPENLYLFSSFAEMNRSRTSGDFPSESNLTFLPESEHSGDGG